MTIEITLSHPPRELHPNARVHFRVKAMHTKRRRGDVQLMGLAVRNRRCPMDRAGIRCVWTFRTNQRRDPDNLTAWLKSTIDGLVDAGVFEDDWNVQVRHHEIVIDKRRPPTLTLYIEDEGPTAGSEAR